MLVLQVAQSLATLWLLHLSADVVNLGVGRDDRAYVIHTGTVMLSLSVLQVILAVGASVVGARLAMRYGCDLRPAGSGLCACAGLFFARDEPLRHAVADHAKHQRCLAVADGAAGWPRQSRFAELQAMPMPV